MYISKTTKLGKHIEKRNCSRRYWCFCVRPPILKYCVRHSNELLKGCRGYPMLLIIEKNSTTNSGSYILSKKKNDIFTK